MNTPVPAGAAANDDARADLPADLLAGRSALAPVTDISEALPGHDEVVTLSLREALALLDERLAGRVVIPGDPGWDEARAAWNLAVDQRPVAVVVAGSENDIVHAVRTAKGLGLSVAPQATGHNAGPLAAANGLADSLLLRTSELRGVQVDPDLRVARVEAGALWGDVVAAAAPHGLAALAGSSHDVGVVGYTLGGGISWLGRTHGLAANSVLAVELVTADGVRRRVDADHDPELFWAVRGGGGDFGVVTALEFRLYAIAEIVGGTLFFPLERAEEVLQAWAAWTAGVPDTVTSVGRVLRLPPMPELPPFLSGQSFVVVEAAIQESPERADELLAPLRALAPAMDSVHPQPVAELLQLHMDPPAPTPGYGDGMLLAELPPAAVRAFIAAVGPESGSALLSAEIRHVGGGLAPEVALATAAERGTPAPGAVAGLEAEYLVFGVGIAVPGAGEALAASLGRLLSRVEPWRAPVDYLNFAEHERPAERLFGERVHRLRAVKQAVDPTGVIRSNHPVGR
ncbi:FAD/FMN-containing dehydrogenase [Agromyces ramosus]|uniref:FAD/FMN-containing dehydrogenase n=1 Tax=Agromyces ramosus TaxID=33879 RepID=A0A4Q7M9R9_9MICO|nr:FAD-binding oxidoreductase [Agromyces ramosus]RZS64624.1 FAD/FMN-containing dehydrogenase [Agromyces ramosus]